MKLRTNKNSIRLRLSQSEMNELAEAGCVHESVQLLPGSSGMLKYSLIVADHEKLNISFSANHLRVYIPLKQAEEWISTDLVGIETRLPVSDSEQLFVLLEKDFKCLTDRTYEDETDNFPNPLASITC
jgi:hypothetical protein